MSEAHGPRKPELHGIVAEYDDPDDLLHAAKDAWKEGYREMDAYSPFPIHGLAEALGFYRPGVAPFTLVAGLAGAAGGFLLQVIGRVYHYPYLIGARPQFSWPAFIPITFELMVLFSAFTTGFAMILLNGLPRPHHPIFNAENFDRASSDRFFLCIESSDTRFDKEKTKSFLQGMHPTPLNVSEVNDD